MNRIAQPTPEAFGVSDSHAMPLYHQVYLVLRENIQNGTYGGDVPVPTETELCNAFGVSRITVKRAMRTLADEGLITRRRGKGTFVASKQKAAPRRDSLDDLLRSVIEIGASTGMKRIEAKSIAASPEVAAQLRCAPGELVFFVSQIRSSANAPIAWIRAYIPEDVAARLPYAKTSAQPVLAQLEQAGVKASSAEQAITATLADPTAAAYLGVDVGAPLIRIARCVYDAERRPVEWLVALYRADMYEYRTTLNRGGLSGSVRAPVRIA